MSMGPLEYLFGPSGKLATWFDDNGQSTTVAYGEKARARQDNQGAGRANRVVFQLGREDGTIGQIEGAHQRGMRENSGNARSIGNGRAIFTVWVWARNSDSTNNELLQDDAAFSLQEKTMQALKAIVPGMHRWGKWDRTTRTERSFGTEFRTEVEIQIPFLSEPVSLAHPTTFVIAKDPPEIPEEP